MERLARAIMLIVALTLPLVIFGSPSAWASGNSGAHGVALGLASWPVVLAGLCGVGSSQLTTLLTHRDAPQWLKSGVNLLFTSLAGVLITVTVVPGKRWEDYLAEIGVAEVLSLASHYAGLTALAAAATSGRGYGASLPPLVATQPGTAGVIQPRYHQRSGRRT